jgi:Zn-dependent M28 family amino/carboxypeptidase
MTKYGNIYIKGAYDDTSGVVTILEVLRALVHSPQLPHSVIFLLNDAEEMGLFGSAYFVLNSPYAQQYVYEA